MDQEQEQTTGPGRALQKGALAGELAEAVERVRGGDRAAFAELVGRLERPLRAWLVTRAWPGIDVDEVAQRAFVQAYLQPVSYTHLTLPTIYSV